MKEEYILVNYVPSIGIVLFLLLFIYSSTLYPGGSQANIDTLGYDWVNNYWCNLMVKIAVNGEINHARPYAITGIIILCISLLLFFFQFAITFQKKNIWRNIFLISGLFSMLSASLIFTSYHDQLTIISSVFGLYVLIIIIKEIYTSDMDFYKIIGMICIILLAFNNVIYYTSLYLEWLPIIQKITFCVVLFWVIGMNYEIVKKLKFVNKIS